MKSVWNARRISHLTILTEEKEEVEEEERKAFNIDKVCCV